MGGYNVTGIGERAFQNCSTLNSITISETITTIKFYAFYGCTGLTTITIPGTVTSIKNLAFSFCTNLNSINVDVSNANYSSENGILFNKEKNEIIYYPEGKTDLTYEIPLGVTNVKKYAFYKCLFNEITISETVTTIEEEAFNYCYHLDSINVDTNNTNYSSEDGVLFNKLKTIIIRYPIGKTYEMYHIPETVTIVETSAFWECTRLTSINLPEGLATIKVNAFNGCENLINMEIPNGLISIEASAFYSCENLTTINIPETVTKIDDEFMYCYKLNSINVDENNMDYSSEGGILFNKAKTTIMRYPAGKTEVSYNIPITVTTIGRNAFNACKSLVNIKIPKTVTAIGMMAFSYCTNLTKIVIPEGVTIIYPQTFLNCNKLKKIVVPNSVTSIDEAEFYGCHEFKIYCYKDSYIETYAKGRGLPYESFTGSIILLEYRMENEEYITEISPNTMLTELLDNVESNYEITIYNEENEITGTVKIGTGMKLRVNEEEYTLVITGDMNGDGDVTTTDLSKIRQHIAQITTLAGAYEKAGDTTGEGDITGTDLSKVRRHIAGLELIGGEV